MRMILSILSILLLPIALAAPGFAAPVFKAGAFAIDVTPQNLPVRVAGSISEKWADTVTDPLHARCLVLDDESLRVAIVVVDSCLMDRAMLDKAKALAGKPAGIREDHILISATHTHTAPAVVGVHGTEPHLDYREFLVRQIAAGIVKAAENLAPARVGWGAGRCEEFVFCRRWLMKPGTAFEIPFTDKTVNTAQMNPGFANENKIRPTGPVDPAVTILSIQSAGGAPLAVLGNYSTHYAGSIDVSADYFAVFADEFGKLAGAAADGDPPFVGIMSNGASGDANCTDASQPRRDYDRFTVGKAVAVAAYEAYKKIEYRDRVPLVMTQHLLSLNVRRPSEEEFKKATAWLRENVGDRPIKTWEEDYARETTLLYRMPSTREIVLQAIRIGDFGMAALPCEVYGGTGLRIKAESPLPTTMLICLANGYEGYLPPPDQHALGGYTTWRARTSCLEIDAEPKIVETTLRLLREVSKTRRDEKPGVD